MKIKCDICGREQNSKPRKGSEQAKLPPGWKEHLGKKWCRACWSEQYVLRAVTLPVAKLLDGEWKEFFDELKKSWSYCTDIANWAVTELARNDISRKAGDEKLAPQPKTYLYTGAREVAPELSTSSVVALLHAVEGRYKKARFKTIWLRQASHPVYQYPVPLPVHNQGWEAFQTEGGGAAVSVRVGSRRWNLALATKGRRPQFTAWKKILAGEAIAGELSIIGQRVTRSDHRRNGEDREAGGGRKIQHRVMIKMVAWFPKKEAQAKEGTMYLKTGANYLLAYHIGIDGEPKYLFAEHVKRWRTQHSRHVMRIANDMKYEKRWPTRMRTQIGEMQDTWVHKFRNRIKTFCHETSVMLAKFAERRGVATVVWDDSNQGFIDQFPWYQLKQMLKYKLNERGIEFTEVTEKKETKTKKKVDKS